MQGVGVFFLAFAGWLGYSALHSYRPIAMLKAIIAAPATAGTLLKSTDTAVAANGVTGSPPSANTGGSSPFDAPSAATTYPAPGSIKTIPVGYSSTGQAI